MTFSAIVERWRTPGFIKDIEGTLRMLLVDRSLAGPADLRGMVVGLDGAIADLEFVSFEQCTISQVDFAYSRFSCSFARSLFENNSFTSCTFDTCNMSKARFTACEYHSARFLAPTMNDTEYEACDFTDSRVEGRGTKGYGGRRAEFHCCNFNKVTLRNIELRACMFVKCTFEGALFENCDLRGLKIKGSRIDQTQFKNCNMAGAMIDSANA
jgi:uncharacterized protein YjbI with pentapeptide repeats